MEKNKLGDHRHALVLNAIGFATDRQEIAQPAGPSEGLLSVTLAQTGRSACSADGPMNHGS